MKHVELEEALLAIELLPELLDYNEPIGPIDKEARASLEAAITQPFISFSGKSHYRYLHQKAAQMFYLIIKDHSLENGNKRSAVIITMFFLYKNGKTFNFTPDALYNVACLVAEGNPDTIDADTAIGGLAKAFKDRIIDR